MGTDNGSTPETLLVIFDLDGTLVDSRADIVTALNRGLQEVGAEPQKAQEIIALVGRPLVEIFEALLPGPLKDRAGQASQIYRQCYFDESSYSTSLYPGVSQCLQKLAGRKLAVATTKPTTAATRVIRRLGLEVGFDLIQGSENLPTKPDPAVVHKVLEALDTQPHQAWMVGDTVYDIQAGKRANLRTCGVTYGFGQPEQLVKAEPDVLLDNLAKFPALL